MDKAALAKLKRTVLQQLAKREDVRANAKSTDIIDLLLEKHPQGVPGLQSPVNEHLEQNTSGRENKRQRLNTPTPDISTTDQGARGFQPNSPSPSRHSQKIRESVPRSNKSSMQLLDRSLRVLGNKDVRSVKREIARLINDGVTIREAVDETELLVAHAMSVANEMSKDIREISWMRYCVEMGIVYELKYDRTLWDGTRLMSDDEEREKRESFLTNSNQWQGAKSIIVHE